MDGILQYLVFWFLYALFASLAFWCWRQMFYRLERGSDLRSFLNMLGVVLLYTPAPIAEGSGFFAPAFVVFPFALLTNGLMSAMYSLNWFLAGLCIGAVVLAIVQITRRVTARSEG